MFACPQKVGFPRSGHINLYFYLFLMLHTASLVCGTV